MHPVASLTKNKVWMLALEKLGPYYKTYWHVIGPTRLLREVHYQLLIAQNLQAGYL